MRARLLATMILAMLPASTASANTQVLSFEFQDFPIADPCAGGEVLLLSGDQRVIIHSSQDATGDTHFSAHDASQSLSAIGSTSGVRYRVVSVGSLIENGTGAPSEMTLTATFKLVGQGSADNLQFHSITHLTVDAGGTITASVSRVVFDCQ